jgi:hypothetical protein
MVGGTRLAGFHSGKARQIVNLVNVPAMLEVL